MEIPFHYSDEATPRDRGYGLGVAQAELVTGMVATYERLFEVTAAVSPSEMRRLGGEAMSVIGELAPDLAEEIEGIAAGSGHPVELIGALNARTELLSAARGECSTVACMGNMTTDGHPIGLQTWDWHRDIAPYWMVWQIDHPDGRRLETMTEAGIVGKVGVNSSGVGVFLNILGHGQDGPPIGMPVHVLCRQVLDQATSALGALQILGAAEMSASSAVTVVGDDHDGGVCCTVELSPAGPGFVMPDERGVLVHTNHYLAHPGRLNDTMLRTLPDTVLRLDHARRGIARVEEGSADDSVILEVMRSHRGGTGAICCHPDDDAPFGERWQTLATITIRPATRELVVRRGGPCERETAALVIGSLSSERTSSPQEEGHR